MHSYTAVLVNNSENATIDVLHVQKERISVTFTGLRRRAMYSYYVIAYNFRGGSQSRTVSIGKLVVFTMLYAMHYV